MSEKLYILESVRFEHVSSNSWVGAKVSNGQSFTVCSAGNPTYLIQIVGWTSKACFLWVLTLRFRSRFCLFQAQICERMWVKDGPSFLLFVSIYIYMISMPRWYIHMYCTHVDIFIYIYIFIFIDILAAGNIYLHSHYILIGLFI